MANFRKNLFDIIDEDNKAEHPLNGTVSIIIMTLIILSVTAVILESDIRIVKVVGDWFFYFEAVAVFIFTIEYLSRLITADYLHPDVSKNRARLKYMFSAMAIIDLLAIIPFYFELAHSLLLMFGIKSVIDLRFIRVLRLMRLLRIFKLNRYSSSMKLISTVLKDEKEKLLITIFMTSILLILSSALIYTVEHEQQPEQFPNIISSMWWSIATLTTVGYGDVFPVTGLGKMLAGFIALLGIGLVALPTGILSSSFVRKISEETDQNRNIKRVSKTFMPDDHETEDAFCPHCGKSLLEHHEE